MDLYASNEWSTFKFNGLRWKTAKFKSATYQACSYTVMTPPGGYKGGKVMMKVTDPEAGVLVYLEQNGKSIKATAGTVYTVDVDQKLQISAVPLKDNYNTTFSIEYKTTGVKDETAPIFLKLEEHKAKIAAKLGISTGLTTRMIAIIVGASVVGVGLIFICVMKARQAKNHE